MNITKRVRQFTNQKKRLAEPANLDFFLCECFCFQIKILYRIAMRTEHFRKKEKNIINLNNR